MVPSFARKYEKKKTICTYKQKTNSGYFAFLTFFTYLVELLEDSEVKTNDVLGGEDDISFDFYQCSKLLHE